jgi:hypothetical protein
MEITWIVILQQIFEVAIIPLIGVLTGVLIKYINSKSAEAITAVDNEQAKKYIALLDNTITSCVLATTQTYVDTLKKAGSFDAAAQKTAFEMTYNAVLDVLTEDAKDYLTAFYGDLNAYMTNKIEAEVQNTKNIISK